MMYGCASKNRGIQPLYTSCSHQSIIRKLGEYKFDLPLEISTCSGVCKLHHYRNLAAARFAPILSVHQFKARSHRTCAGYQERYAQVILYRRRPCETDLPIVRPAGYR